MSQKDVTNHYVFSYDPASKRMIFEINNNGSLTKTYSNTWEPALGTWYHVALTRREGAFNFYLNGVAHGEDYNFQTVSIPNIVSTINFDPFEGTSFYDGKIDEFRFWTVARSEDQLATFKTENILERTTGLIGEYRFDGRLDDSSLSYNDGSLSIGSPSYMADDDSITDPINKHKLRLRLNSVGTSFWEYYQGNNLTNPSVGSGYCNRWEGRC